ncbi:hypothetical protein HYV10_01425 [Candidatus Dependentiae bacterium]|nr:hypothetical protein [Candidatus Dependentiae bacterium]
MNYKLFLVGYSVFVISFFSYSSDKATVVRSSRSMLAHAQFGTYATASSSQLNSCGLNSTVQSSSDTGLTRSMSASAMTTAMLQENFAKLADLQENNRRLELANAKMATSFQHTNDRLAAATDALQEINEVLKTERKQHADELKDMQNQRVSDSQRYAKVNSENERRHTKDMVFAVSVTAVATYAFYQVQSNIGSIVSTIGSITKRISGSK